MGLPTEIAKKLANVEAVTKSGTKLRQGEYVLVVKRILATTSEQTKSGSYLIPECDIEAAEQTDPAVTPNVKGSDCSFTFPMDAQGFQAQYRMRDMQDFFCPLLDIVADDDFITSIDKYVGPRDTEDSLRARGRVVHVLVTLGDPVKTGKNAGKSFPEYAFSFVEQTDADVAKRRAELDKNKR